MSYKLSTGDDGQKRESLGAAIRRLLPLMLQEGGRRSRSPSARSSWTSAATLSSPYIIGQTVDHDIAQGNYAGVIHNGLILLGIYLVALVTSYVQTRTMGGVGRRILFNLRNALFTKLQELPVAFFNQNRAGDLISRINNDTDKLNQFFAQALMQFLSNGFLIVGSGILLLVLNVRLGGAALLPAVAVLIITQLVSGWVKRSNFRSLQTLGSLSGEIQESLANFKVVVAFNRLDYFRKKFNDANAINYAASIKAGIANNIFVPLYGLAYNVAQLIVLTFGIWMITRGELTTGLLIGFLLYVNNFYNSRCASWRPPGPRCSWRWPALDRISEVMALTSDMALLPAEIDRSTATRRCHQLSRACPSPIPDSKDVLSAMCRFRLGARQDLCAGRADRRRQNHDRFADGAAVRSDRRHRPCSTARDIRSITSPKSAPSEDRLHPAGAIPVHRHGPRQHPLWQRFALVGLSDEAATARN